MQYEVLKVDILFVIISVLAFKNPFKKRTEDAKMFISLKMSPILYLSWFNSPFRLASWKWSDVEKEKEGPAENELVIWVENVVQKKTQPYPWSETT